MSSSVSAQLHFTGLHAFSSEVADNFQSATDLFSKASHFLTKGELVSVLRNKDTIKHSDLRQNSLRTLTDKIHILDADIHKNMSLLMSKLSSCVCTATSQFPSPTDFQPKVAALILKIENLEDELAAYVTESTGVDDTATARVASTASKMLEHKNVFALMKGKFDDVSKMFSQTEQEGIVQIRDTKALIPPVSAALDRGQTMLESQQKAIPEALAKTIQSGRSRTDSLVEKIRKERIKVTEHDEVWCRDVDSQGRSLNLDCKSTVQEVEGKLIRHDIHIKEKVDAAKLDRNAAISDMVVRFRALEETIRKAVEDALKFSERLDRIDQWHADTHVTLRKEREKKMEEREKCKDKVKDYLEKRCESIYLQSRQAVELQDTLSVDMSEHTAEKAESWHKQTHNEDANFSHCQEVLSDMHKTNVSGIKIRKGEQTRILELLRKTRQSFNKKLYAKATWKDVREALWVKADKIGNVIVPQSIEELEELEEQEKEHTQRMLKNSGIIVGREGARSLQHTAGQGALPFGTTDGSFTPASLSSTTASMLTMLASEEARHKQSLKVALKQHTTSLSSSRKSKRPSSRGSTASNPLRLLQAMDEKVKQIRSRSTPWGLFEEGADHLQANRSKAATSHGMKRTPSNSNLGDSSSFPRRGSMSQVMTSSKQKLSFPDSGFLPILEEPEEHLGGRSVSADKHPKNVSSNNMSSKASRTIRTVKMGSSGSQPLITYDMFTPARPNSRNLTDLPFIEGYSEKTRPSSSLGSSSERRMEEEEVNDDPYATVPLPSSALVDPSSSLATLFKKSTFSQEGVPRDPLLKSLYELQDIGAEMSLGRSDVMLHPKTSDRGTAADRAWGIGKQGTSTDSITINDIKKASETVMRRTGVLINSTRLMNASIARELKKKERTKIPQFASGTFQEILDSEMDCTIDPGKFPDQFAIEGIKMSSVSAVKTIGTSVIPRPPSGPKPTELGHGVREKKFRRNGDE
ncbi:hypothetical protein ADUPG1_010397 [Aduncisulcus paluster]|uniref:Uncharacterized protein n=1 Tax=Aduncisulcus paluster TaxID=2918883 RepID=A0ABQ5JR77_9EUKA|nr:hypothetical protein ADUPG1_010397 [Aduncisulcus paluster]